MNDLQQKIHLWAETAVEKYLGMIKDGWDYAFYTQSDLRVITSNPEYFLIQINPGSDGKYSEQKTNPYWELNGYDMDAEHFIRGNYGVDSKDGNTKTAWERRMKWKNFRRLYALFSKIEGGNPLDKVENFILTNASPFNTGKAAEKINNIIIPQTLPITLSLVEITHPQKIIILGSPLPPFISRLVSDCEIKGTSLPRICYGQIYGIETLFIDHPCARTSKNDTKDVLRLWNVMPLEEAIIKTVLDKHKSIDAQ